MLIGLAIAAVIGSCDWNTPGADPYVGDVQVAIDRYTDIPADVREQLRRKSRARDCDDFEVVLRIPSPMRPTGLLPEVEDGEPFEQAPEWPYWPPPPVWGGPPQAFAPGQPRWPEQPVGHPTPIPEPGTLALLGLGLLVLAGAAERRT
jgi:hypothetical protein